MKYIADSFTQYILKRINSQLPAMELGRKMIFMVESIPEALILATADSISSHFIEQNNYQILIKIARKLTDSWTESGKTKADLAGWRTPLENLAYYRNEIVPENKYNIIILYGSDTVTDAASLADFNLCNLKMVWEFEMQRSFAFWINSKLQDNSIVFNPRTDLPHFDKILYPIIEQGRADLISLSTWLQTLDLTHCDSVPMVMELILSNLHDFQLPSFHSFPYLHKNKRFSPYIYKAIDFFNYTMFIEDQQKKKALKAVEGIIEAQAIEPEAWESLENDTIKGAYATGHEFLEGLKDYIQNEDDAQRAKLLKSDFAFILDKIFKYRKKQEKKEKASKKLEGSPLEMLLSALWNSFYEFSRSKDFGNVQELSKIEIRSELFKHDMEWDDSDGEYSTQDVADLAKEYLQRLIGGLDSFVMQHHNLKNIHAEEIELSCSLLNEELKYRYSSAATAELSFSVYLYSKDTAKPCKRQYTWKLPAEHSYRLAVDLLQLAATELDLAQHALVLPFFHLPYYDEILQCSANEELRRIFLHSLRDSGTESSFINNLISGSWLKREDIILPFYKRLAERYHFFIKAASQKGLIAALSDTTLWDTLRQQYEEVLDLISGNENYLKSPLAAMILKAFMVLEQNRPQNDDTWYGTAYEKSCLITVLHPSLLEMLQAQMVYQCSCFNYAIKIEMEKETHGAAFKKHIWQSYLDLSKIKSPINCILADEGLNLNTRVWGDELIHKVGTASGDEKLKSTRLLQGITDTGAEDTADISDTDMFLETRESKLINYILINYFSLHPHARDGVNIAVYRNQDIQPLIAAIHAFLMKLSDDRDPNYCVISKQRETPYPINVSIFTESIDDSGIAKWIDMWKERWEAAETDTKFQVYRKCHFSISHRMINSNEANSFLRMINENFSTDIIFLYDIISSSSIADRFISVDPMDIRTHSLKYPILEKALATIDNPANILQRQRIMSNRQFSLSTKLSSCMHAIKINIPQSGTVVIGTGDIRPWKELIAAIHKRSQWVVCIDPSVDDQIIRDSDEQDETPAQKREIIGFGSGVGISGEDNYTISTQHFSLNDIKLNLKYSIEQLFADPSWSEEDYQNIASGTMKVALELSGISLVRATGVADQYIRDFMAYALTRKIVGKNPDILCDSFITLDAYRHWFDFAEYNIRPDLLWLKAKLGDDRRLHLDLHLIECKMAKNPKALLQDAKNQIDHGLSVLVKAFKPNFHEAHNLDDDKPDRRYWWMQLHRLIAAKAKTDSYQKDEVISALEKMAEGDYEVNWNASVMAFGIDDIALGFKHSGAWDHPDTSSGKVNVFTIGKDFIKELALDPEDKHQVFENYLYVKLADAENIMQEIADNYVAVPLNDEDYKPVDYLTEWGDDEAEDDESDASPDWDNDPIPELQQEGSPMGQADLDHLPEDDDQPLDKDDNDFAKIPKRILLGKTTGGKEVYWEFGHDNLPNRHVVIFGTSGMGKTYAIQCILCELAKHEQRSLILDYTDGFIPSKIEENAKSWIPDTAQNFIRKKPLPINPFKASVTYEAGMAFPDTPDIIAKRVSSIFKSVYALGEQQFSLLVHAITAGVSLHGDDYSLDTLLQDLPNYINNSHYTKTTIQTTITKISPFISSNPFTNEKTQMSWEQIFSEVLDRITVFQFFQMDKDSARALIEFVLWDLYHYVSKEGSKNKPKVVILDEIQNLDLGQNAPVAKYLTEGRKHGLALISATQTLRGVGGVTDPKVSRLTQSDLKLFFKPSINEIREHAQLLNVSFNYRSVSDWSNELSKLRKGECWAVGMFVNDQTGVLESRAMKVKISSLEERGFNG